MRQQWILLAMLACVVPRVDADEPGARTPGTTADTRPSVRGMDFDVYIRLRKGMTEGELLERAGPPDHQTVDGSIDRRDVVRRGESNSVSVYSAEVKTFYYFSTAANAFTTVVTMTGGRITDLKRERKF